MLFSGSENAKIYRKLFRYCGIKHNLISSQTGEITWGDGFIRLEERIFQSQRNYLLPIPQNEMDRNPNMTQNPGY
ncbi:MAG: RagB/SusD family nutrient uptake outer membrane protein [Tannerella sp.]|jgi:hypothetical protein|nr:RagB/SusD family nutrient uptake outer membrane protein [Tannerella sp.]